MCIFRPLAFFLGILLIRQGFCDPMVGVSGETMQIGLPAFLLAPILAFPLTKTGGKLGCLLALFLVPLSWFIGIYVQECLLGATGLSGALAGAMVGGLTSFSVLKLLYAFLESRVQQ